MKRYVIPVLLLMAAALCGCQKKPPAEMVGKWEHVEDLGLFGKVALRVNLKETGRFTVRKKVMQPPAAPGGMNLPQMPSVSDGPENADGELMQGGTWEVKDGDLKLVVDTAYVAGVDVGATQVHTVHSKYALQNGTLILETKALGISAPAPMPGAPTPTVPTSLSFTKVVQ